MRNVSKSAQHQSQRILKAPQREIQSRAAKSAHLKSQRKLSSQQRHVPLIQDLLSQYHVQRSSLKIAQSAHHVLSAQIVQSVQLHQIHVQQIAVKL